MKIIKRLLPVLFSLLFVLAPSILCGCSRTDSSDAEEVIKSELDQLKNLDSDTTQKYISYTEMFPDATENTNLSDEIQNVFSLFFQQFDYKILDVSVDEDKKNAQASLELTTIDAKSLAADFAAELLRTKITEDAQARMLKEAVQTSYRRGGEETSLTTEVKKQTVKNKIHALEFPKNNEKPVKKKVVEYLYIEADEDHASLQFREKKGDLIENENHRKNNCLITKLVYVHEGIEKEAPKSKRQKLINPHYFCGTSYEENNTEFWDEIYEYISNHYDLDKVKKIYLSSDGGTWIKSGMKRIAGITYVLDEFHLEKYLIKLTSHMKDSREDPTSTATKAPAPVTKFVTTAEPINFAVFSDMEISSV